MISVRRKFPGPDAGDLDTFLGISSVLTGFSRLDLEGTGMVRTYYETFARGTPGMTTAAFFALARTVLSRDSHAAIDEGVRRQIITDPTFGPLSQSLIKLWYYATWSSNIVSAKAYVEGLVWPAIGTHPRGAKQPGFGTWALPPPGPPSRDGEK